MSETCLQTVIDQEGEIAHRSTLQRSPGPGPRQWDVGGSLAFTTDQSARLFLITGDT